MKKFLLAAAFVAAGVASMNAQLLKQPNFFDNMSLGLDGGVTTPLNHGAFWGDMRGVVGLHLEKRITPIYGVGIEALWGVNTSSWQNMPYAPHKSTTAFDSQYVGIYGMVNLNSLFCGWGSEKGRVFDIDAVAGAGWGHLYYNKYMVTATDAAGVPVGPDYNATPDHNFFATKAGLNFNFYPSEKVKISLKPSVLWDMSDAGVHQTSAAYNANKATFNFLASVGVTLGGTFEYLEPYNQAEIDALNRTINELRADNDNCGKALAEAQARNRQLQRQLDECLNKGPEVKVVKETEVKVVKENETITNDFLQTVRYVFYTIGKSNIRADQMPNVEQIAVYLKNHPKATVVVKGYASQDGPLEINERLAKERAASVKNALISKYGIAADRIDASGQGIGHMFDEESWNRVAICILENNAPVNTSTSTSTSTSVKK